MFDKLDSYITEELNITLKEYRYVNIGGKALYVEGQGGIISLSAEQIELKMGKRTCTIKGADLYIKYYDNSTALVLGKIVSVVVL